MPRTSRPSTISTTPRRPQMHTISPLIMLYTWMVFTAQKPAAPALVLELAQQPFQDNTL